MAVIRDEFLPGAPKARRLVKEIRQRIDMSWRQISQNFELWDDVEEHYRTFRVADEEDRESWRKNQVKKIIVPIQFATIQTIVTFMMEVFTGLKPVLKVRGADPASVRPSRIMELLLDYDYRGNRGYLMFHQWFLNQNRYGYGVIGNTWGKTLTTKKVMRPSPSSNMSIDGLDLKVPGAMQIIRDYFTIFEGNKWEIVDNRYFFPDPRWPLTRFQEGEFCAHRKFIHDHELRKMEDQGLFFNTTRIETSTGYGGGVRDAETGALNNRRDRVTPEGAFQKELMDAKRNRMHIDESIVMEIVPKDWELDDVDQPEDWLFDLIDGATIVRAEPAPFLPRFPYAIIESFPDILAYMSPSLMEVTEPLAAHLTFLFNSHMANVRKAVNDTLLVDPSRVDLRDLLDPAAGKLVRLLPSAYGQDPAQFVKQLMISDITQGHIQDARMVMDLWHKILGTSESMFGQVTAGRKTATDVQTAMRMSGSRMMMLADLSSSEGIAPLTEMMALTRQENMTMDQFVELAGQSAQDLGVDPSEIIGGWLKARRDHLAGVYQYPAEDGVSPQDRQKAGDVLTKAFEAVGRFPFLQQAFDPVEIFKELIRQYGLNNLDDFTHKMPQFQAQVLPGDQVREMAARGQIQPTGRPNEGVRQSQEGLSLNGQYGGAGIPSATA
jgi:hypothetical protein